MNMDKRVVVEFPRGKKVEGVEEVVVVEFSMDQKVNMEMVLVELSMGQKDISCDCDSHQAVRKKVNGFKKEK